MSIYDYAVYEVSQEDSGKIAKSLALLFRCMHEMNRFENPVYARLTKYFCQLAQEAKHRNVIEDFIDADFVYITRHNDAVVFYYNGDWFKSELADAKTITKDSAYEKCAECLFNAPDLTLEELIYHLVSWQLDYPAILDKYDCETLLSERSILTDICSEDKSNKKEDKRRSSKSKTSKQITDEDIAELVDEIVDFP